MNSILTYAVAAAIDARPQFSTNDLEPAAVIIVADFSESRQALKPVHKSRPSLPRLGSPMAALHARI
jgi:hypothetical protein